MLFLSLTGCEFLRIGGCDYARLVHTWKMPNTSTAGCSGRHRMLEGQGWSKLKGTTCMWGGYIRCVERAHVTSTNRTHSQHFSNMGAPMGSFVPPAASESTGGSICRSPSLYCSWQRVSALLKDASVSAWICSAKSKMGRLFCHNKFGDNHITT